ncbi:hypothetical protein ACGFZL_24635 [Streptomyces sp. NPDC048182]|uniref:hypothetical protein n=1 Tax=Streptomyces sp. NPDC048182 TaxID=3365507 RepID=UPI003722FA3B
MEPDPPLADTLNQLHTLLQQRGIHPADVLDPQKLSAQTALPEDTVRALLEGRRPPPDTVSERVRNRIKALADAHLAHTGRPMSDLAAHISRQLGISTYWARQVCAGQKMPSVELLHGLVTVFHIDQGETFFTRPAPQALHHTLQHLLTTLKPPTPPTTTATPHDIRGIALRQAHNLPPERWNILNATLHALLQLDNNHNPDDSEAPP